MSLTPLDSCAHRFSIHGLAVDLHSQVPLLNIPIDEAMGNFAVDDFPDGFLPTSGAVMPYDESVVLRHLSPTAATVGNDLGMELYGENERFWVVDDRWGIAEINLLKNQFQSWVLPAPAIELPRVVELAVLWPLAQLLRTRGMSLLPAAAVVRDGWGMLLIAPFSLEPELVALAGAGFRIVSQRWAAIREDDGRVAMLHMPGKVERIPAPRPRAAGHVEQSIEWVDLTAEIMGVSQNHAFCDAVVLVDNGRRPMPSFRQINRSMAVTALRQAWPIVELHPQRKQASLPVKLAQHCTCFEAQFSRRPEDFLKLLDQMRYGRSGARSITPAAVQVTVDPRFGKSKQVPA